VCAPHLLEPRGEDLLISQPLPALHRPCQELVACVLPRLGAALARVLATLQPRQAGPVQPLLGQAGQAYLLVGHDAGSRPMLWAKPGRPASPVSWTVRPTFGPWDEWKRKSFILVLNQLKTDSNFQNSHLSAHSFKNYEISSVGLVFMIYPIKLIRKIETFYLSQFLFKLE
jgi:hypothetical protein